MATTKLTVRCPHCGMEYSLDELFVSKYILGRSDHVVRDPLGNIILIDYITEDSKPYLTEQYICDGCNKQFNVELTIKAKAEAPDEETDFSTESASLLD